MTRRPAIVAGMAAGAAWAVGVLVAGQALGQGPDLATSLAIGLAPGGLVLIAMIGWLARRRFFDDATIDGAPFTEPSDRIAQSVLTNTTEQLVLAAATWPFVGLILGGGTVIALGAGFAITRIAFWVGYRLSPPLRAFGFAGGFYATILAVLLALVRAASGTA